MSGTARRDGFIPVPAAVFVRTLAENAPDPAGAAALAQRMAAIFNHETLDERQRLHALYAGLDPEALTTLAVRGDLGKNAFEAFQSELVRVLGMANFTEIPADVWGRPATDQATADVKIKLQDGVVEQARYFGRGARKDSFQRKTMAGLRRKTFEAETWDDVVLVISYREAIGLDAKSERKAEKARRGIRPASVLLKSFGKVARGDLMTLHPAARTEMKPMDQVMLGAPALVGGVPLLIQIGPAIGVIFTVLGAYLGYRGAVEADAVKKALAALSGIVAVGGFMMRQWVKFERSSLKYQKTLAETVYFRSKANNAAVIDSLIGAAADQELKEAFLAWQRLAHANRPMGKTELDKSCEEALLNLFGFAAIDFEIGDALSKAERLGIVQRSSEDTFLAIGTTQASAALEALWNKALAQ
jgi:hypothetical protein